jgi:hypothetical protein
VEIKAVEEIVTNKLKIAPIVFSLLFISATDWMMRFC